MYICSSPKPGATVTPGTPLEAWLHPGADRKTEAAAVM